MALDMKSPLAAAGIPANVSMLGVAINPHQVTMTLMQNGVFAQHASAALSQNTIANGSVQDPAALAKALTDLTETLKTKTRYVTATVSFDEHGTTATITRETLQNISAAEVATAAPIAAQRELSYKVEEAAIGYQLLPSESLNDSEVLMQVYPLHSLVGLHEAMDLANLKLLSAVHPLVARIAGAASGAAVQATLIASPDNGNPCWVIHQGSNLLNYSPVPSVNEARSASVSETYMRNIADTVFQAYSSMQVTAESQGHSVHSYQGIDLPEGLQEALATHGLDLTPLSTTPGHSQRLAAMGAAISAIRSPTSNLLPPKLRAKLPDRRLTILTYAIPAVMLAALTLTSASVALQNNAERGRQMEANTTLSSLQPFLDETLKLQKDNSRIQTVLGIEANARRALQPWSDHLNKLTAKLSGLQGVRLRKLNADAITEANAGTINAASFGHRPTPIIFEVDGFAKTQENIDEMVREMNVDPWTINFRSQTTQKDGTLAWQAIFGYNPPPAKNEN